MWFFNKKESSSSPENLNRPGKASSEPPTILLVVDGGSLSARSLDYALLLALAQEASLFALYVVDTASMDYLSQMKVIISDELEEFRTELEAKGNGYLERVSQAASKAGVLIETQLVTGRFNRTITEIVRERNVQLVVMGCWTNSDHVQDMGAKVRSLLLDQVHCPVAVIK